MRSIILCIKASFTFLLLFLVYVAGCIAYGTYTDYQPIEQIPIKLDNYTKDTLLIGQKLSILNWNIGYAGLGASSNFFYDDGRRFFSAGGKMVRNTREAVEDNLRGISTFLQKHSRDFILLQEVDLDSRRSYYYNQHEHIAALFPTYTKHHALNYSVRNVPIPLLSPWDVIGKVKSGLSIFSKYRPFKATRHQFPGSYDWPNYIFHLDRCMVVQYFHTKNGSKKLILINTHNSAYDKGQINAMEMQYFKEFIVKKYAEGHYIIVGGDWNQTPPGLACQQAAMNMGLNIDSSYCPANIPTDFLPTSWHWAYDAQTASNRSLRELFKAGKTPVSLVDYYLVSPNIKVHSVEGHSLEFKYSDHNPVSITLELKRDSSLQKQVNTPNSN